MNPFIPHFSSECLSNIGQKDIKWPIATGDLLIDDKINFVIQINGKKRGLVTVDRNIRQDKLIEKIKLDNNLNKYLKNKEIKKEISSIKETLTFTDKEIKDINKKVLKDNE